MSRPAPVREGEIIAGKYRVERVLGEGGMGVVVAAHHLGLDERVAVKLLSPEYVSNEEAIARFFREAQAAAKIKSEHVARVVDVGALPNGAPFIVMEYLEGCDLAELLKQRGPLPVDEAIDYVLQAGEALAEAHSLGFVHRDIKPSNLFVTRAPDGSAIVKVLDFGVSKRSGVLGDIDVAVTRAQALVGSPLYMAPEQMRAQKDLDARADLWSLGVVLHELVAGKVPYHAETVPDLCALVLDKPPPPLRSVREDVPEGVEQTVLRCLEKDREARFSSMAELARALVPFGGDGADARASRIERLSLGTRSFAPPRSRQSSSGDSPTLGASEPALALTRVQSPTSRRATMALFVAIGAAVLALAYLVFPRSSGDGPMVPPEPAAAPLASVAPSASAEPVASVTLQPSTVMPLTALPLAGSALVPWPKAGGKAPGRGKKVDDVVAEPPPPPVETAPPPPAAPPPRPAPSGEHLLDDRK